jgi:peptide/nickel transport system permease protein
MTEIIGFAGRRMLSAAITLWIVSIVIFAVIHALPGDYADVFLGAQSTPEARARIVQRFGLDRSIFAQYFGWLGAAVQGDFGVSYLSQRPVATEFAARLPVTAQLALSATVFAVMVGLPLGIRGGFAPERSPERVVSRLTGSVAMSVPDFFIGSILLYVATLYWGGFGVSGWVPLSDGLLASLGATLLPAISLAGLGIGFVLTSARHASMSVRNGGWIKAAEARGLGASTIRQRHVLRNASIPVVTAISIYFGYMLGGTAIIESTFTLPGVGRYMLQAVVLRDYPVVQAGALIAATVFIGVNLLADIVYALLDPRVRSQ